MNARIISNDSEASMPSVVSTQRRALKAWICLLLAFLAVGCNVSKEGDSESVISFDRIVDSLKQFDEVVIVLKSLNGGVLDTVFQGKVFTAEDVTKLKAPHWDGGKVIVSITGTKAGKVAYQVDTHLDPVTGKKDDIVVYVAPEISLSSTVQTLTLLVGDSLALPPVTVLPLELLDKTLEWHANPATLALLGPGYLKAVQTGTGELTVSLVANPSIMLSIPLSIVAAGLVPESLSIQPESLEVFAGGAPRLLSAKISPSVAASAVNWVSADTNVATVDSAGRVQGKIQGTTTVSASSKVRPNVQGFARIKVSASRPVEKVAFTRDNLEIQLGAAAESLSVSVLPLGADPKVTFWLSDPLKASILNGKISGIAVGFISVIATSVSNPLAKDTLFVTISSVSPNDTVPPLKPVVRVNPVGPTKVRLPIWSWSTGGGGAGYYQVVLDKSIFDSTTLSISDTTYTSAAALNIGVHILYVRERDAAGNWSLPGSAQVEIDTSGPTAPKISGTSPTSALPRWTWTSGGGGMGIYRFRLGDGNFLPSVPESSDSTFVLTSATTGTTYTLYVQERDAAGNWSASASLPITYDLTKPTVTISAPLASGVFTTALDTVTVSGTTSGPNPVTKIEYSLDGGVAIPITTGTNGIWTVKALPITNAKTTVIKVIATDNLGNTGEAALSLLRDSDPPMPPVSLTAPASPTNVASTSWTWAAGSDALTGSGLSGKYRWKLNSGNWNEVSTAAATSVILAEGTNTLSVQEQDKAGNWSNSLTGTAVLDTKAPDAVTFTGIDGSYTASTTPTWTWSPSVVNGGIGTYILKLDAGAEFEWATTSFTPTTAQADNATHTLTVKEKDQVPGISGAAKSFNFKVKVNPPAIPIVSSAAGVANNAATNNPGFTWKSGGGGNGKYRVQINSEITFRTHPQPSGTQTAWSLDPADADGTYSIHVSEQDDMGRWGAVGNFTIQLDRTGPVYTEVFFKGTSLAVRDGYVTNLDTLTLTYKADGVAKELGCKLDQTGAAKICKAANTDGLGNPSTLQRTFYCKKNVVFFKAAASGAKDGSSWENARDDLAGYLNLPATDIQGKDLWLASGNYSSQTLSIFFKWVNIYGGFNAAAFPIDANSRTKTNTSLGSVSLYGSNGGKGILDGLNFSSGLGASGFNFTMKDCQSTGGISVTEGSLATATNVELTGANGSANAVFVGSSGDLTWDGGKISDNKTTGDTYPVHVDAGGTLVLKGTLTVSGNDNPGVFGVQILNDGALTIDPTVSFDCQSIVNNGTGSCRGNPLP